MTFFDEVGKKISLAGQSAVQKTKDLTDVARINGAIAEEEKKINNYYYQIGKLYVTMHAENYENEFQGMINAIKECEMKIHNYSQKIQEIKGVVHCEVCGAEVPNSSVFCSSCGAQMPKKTNEEKVCKCVGCGAVLDTSMRFCTVCGKATNESIQKMQMDESSVLSQEENSGINVIRKCPGCGIDVTKDDLFCPECGMKLE